jgi:hypothetical protein
VLELRARAQRYDDLTMEKLFVVMVLGILLLWFIAWQLSVIRAYMRAAVKHPPVVVEEFDLNCPLFSAMDLQRAYKEKELQLMSSLETDTHPTEDFEFAQRAFEMMVELNFAITGGSKTISAARAEFNAFHSKNSPQLRRAMEKSKEIMDKAYANYPNVKHET